MRVTQDKQFKRRIDTEKDSLEKIKRKKVSLSEMLCIKQFYTGRQQHFIGSARLLLKYLSPLPVDDQRDHKSRDLELDPRASNFNGYTTTIEEAKNNSSFLVLGGFLWFV